MFLFVAAKSCSSRVAMAVNSLWACTRDTPGARRPKACSPNRSSRFLAASPGAEDNALYYWIFPNTMLNIYQDNISTNVILPMGPDRTLTIFEWFFAEPGTGAGWESMQQTIAFSDEIQQEDIAVCEQVQRGLRSRSYTRGRFSALRENGVHHFQSLVTEFLDQP